jgi:hypothetical protein
MSFGAEDVRAEVDQIYVVFGLWPLSCAPERSYLMAPLKTILEALFIGDS